MPNHWLCLTYFFGITPLFYYNCWVTNHLNNESVLKLCNSLFCTFVFNLPFYALIIFKWLDFQANTLMMLWPCFKTIRIANNVMSSVGETWFKINGMMRKPNWSNFWGFKNIVQTEKKNIYIQGVPPICWQIWTKFWKLKNHICQKVSPVLKSLHKNFSDGTLKSGKIKLEVF